MANFKEIVTKAVLGKGKKSFITTHTVTPNCRCFRHGRRRRSREGSD